MHPSDLFLALVHFKPRRGSGVRFPHSLQKVVTPFSSLPFVFIQQHVLHEGTACWFLQTNCECSKAPGGGEMKGSCSPVRAFSTNNTELPSKDFPISSPLRFDIEGRKCATCISTT